MFVFTNNSAKVQKKVYRARVYILNFLKCFVYLSFPLSLFRNSDLCRGFW